MNAPVARADASISACVRSELTRVARALAAEGLPVPSLQGQLHRPALAALVAGEASLPDGFWMAALALEMVHEASLIHDDIVDEASTRRGAPTLVARKGVAGALIGGDLLLTAAYVIAQRSGQPGFARHFAEAVFATVDGERRQGATAGQRLTLDEYHAIVERKTGALFGCAARLGAGARDRGTHADWERLGVELGALYQQVDDLLDYVPGAGTGKPSLQDRRQRKWTWPLACVDGLAWDAPPSTLPTTALQRCVSNLVEQAEGLVEKGADLGCDQIQLRALVERWLRPARVALPDVAAPRGLIVGTVRASAAIPSRMLARGDSRSALLRAHSQSFWLASRLFPREVRHRVAGVYAYCRMTDDLVDQADPARKQETRADLDAWLVLSEDAFRGARTGCALLDQVMGDMRAAAVPFQYVEDLIAGMRMDLEDRTYATMGELRVYTYRVASVVGGWLTELFGVHDRWTLSRAAALGHAMQLTNILRDVGEDLRAGRIYLPTAALSYHGLGRDDLWAMAEGRQSIDHRYRQLMQELMAIAEADYAAAFEAIPRLPTFAQRPVAAAARIYMGIHAAIRRNGYDSLTRRAFTGWATKVRLARTGLRDLQRQRSTELDAALSPGDVALWIPASLERGAVA
ncbi:MAG: squalene/phytoene synthase family protein [Gemmatimonadota bacterium]